MPYQCVWEPLTAEEADRLANACATPTESLIVWTLLDTGLHVGELCALTSKDILWQQGQLRVRGKGGPCGQKSKVRDAGRGAGTRLTRSEDAGRSHATRSGDAPTCRGPISPDGGGRPTDPNLWPASPRGRAIARRWPVRSDLLTTESQR